MEPLGVVGWVAQSPSMDVTARSSSPTTVTEMLDTGVRDCTPTQKTHTSLMLRMKYSAYQQQSKGRAAKVKRSTGQRESGCVWGGVGGPQNLDLFPTMHLFSRGKTAAHLRRPGNRVLGSDNYSIDGRRRHVNLTNTSEAQN
jgi:hypothetical protein